MGSQISCTSLSCFFSSIDNKIEKMIYHPPQRNINSYSNLNTNRSALLQYFTKNGNKISALQITPHGNNCPEKYIVYSHGNSGDIVNMYSYCAKLADELNIGVFIYDYIGYGLSEATEPSEEGCYNSIDATLNYLLYEWKMDPTKIFLVGHSLGTGVIVDYISKHDWTTPVILISPYKSICKIVIDTSCIAPIDKFRSKEKLKFVKCPIKIFHGEHDDVINITHGIKMYNSLTNKTLEPVWFKNTNHHDILDKITKDHYLEVLNY